MMLRACLFSLLLISLALTVNAQSNATIRSLESKRTTLQKEIKQKETLLNTATNSVRTHLRNISTLDGQIADRKRYIDDILLDVDTINRELGKLQHQLDSLAKELNKRKDKYAKSLQRLYRARQLHEKLMFIFSAPSLAAAYRRAHYLQDYAAYQKVLAGAITQQQTKLNLKQQEMRSARAAKETLIQESIAQRQQLETQQQQRQQLVKDLQKQQQGLRKEIDKQRQEANKLNREIDRLVAIEVEKARKRAEEEARKKAAEEKALTAANKGKPTTGTSKTPAKTTTPKMEAYKMSSEDTRLSSNFASNKGKLPIPVTGGYIITGRYGQYSPAGTKGVKLDNKGINIQGQPGAQARAIFDGEVTSIFQVGGLSNVIVRHGTYLSVYCNLSSVSVSQGQRVSTRQVLGNIYSDKSDGNRTTLHFQLRKDTTKLNPEQWLGR